MAALMLKMYDVNLENKSIILEGNTPNAFPEEFINIHTAKLTDPSYRNSSFKVFLDLYLSTFQQDFETDKEDLKVKYNN
jgi:hypothetical protein